jgi:hypothetical protein
VPVPSLPNLKSLIAPSEMKFFHFLPDKAHDLHLKEIGVFWIPQKGSRVYAFFSFFYFSFPQSFQNSAIDS